MPNVIVDKKDKSDDEEIEDDHENDFLNVQSRVDSGVQRKTLDAEDEGDGNHGKFVQLSVGHTTCHTSDEMVVMVSLYNSL